MAWLFELLKISLKPGAGRRAKHADGEIDPSLAQRGAGLLTPERPKRNARARCLASQFRQELRRERGDRAVERAHLKQAIDGFRPELATVGERASQRVKRLGDRRPQRQSARRRRHALRAALEQRSAENVAQTGPAHG